MHIVSYRGPGQAGGVSAALARAWDSSFGSSGVWWHVDANQLKVTSNVGAKPAEVASLPEEVIKGHYRFCNEFLWPIMHDLPQYATFVADDYAYYQSFNETYGWCIMRSQTRRQSSSFFVQDYQLALLPSFLRDNANLRSMVFWHIPWPKNVAPEHLEPLKTIVRSMLGAEAIGFHTEEYAKNFARFVAECLPEYRSNEDTLSVRSDEQVARISPMKWAAPGRTSSRRLQPATVRTTQLVVAPLGIDFDHWTSLASDNRTQFWHPDLAGTRFILSVDRADYTKGVTDRIRAIDIFFEKHPELAGKVVFAQICGKTRTGLQSFDGYWQECQNLHDRLKQRWATGDWQPMLWIEQSYSSAELAHAYRTASGMLVNAVRDGLNLTAKEYVACQQRMDPGVLALSSGTGAWDELGNHVVGLRPNNPEQIADGIHEALSMDVHERRWRMAMLQGAVRSNSLSQWWQTFSDILEPAKETAQQGWG